MADLEKVIYSIERCICHVPDACRDCSKYGGDNAIRCMEELLTDALALLKAQEAMRCKNCRSNHECSIQFKFADAANEEGWFCKNFNPSSDKAVKWDG